MAEVPRGVEVVGQGVGIAARSGGLCFGRNRLRGSSRIPGGGAARSMIAVEPLPVGAVVVGQQREPDGLGSWPARAARDETRLPFDLTSSRREATIPAWT